MEYLVYLLVWVVFGLGLGALAGLIARAVCRRRWMFQLGDRAFWFCLVCGLVHAHFFACIVFCIIAYSRDRDVGIVQGGGAVARSVYNSGADSQSFAGRPLRLVCVSGPLSGQSYALGSGLSIGTDPSNSVRLPAGTPGISRRHCCLRWQNSAPQLIDLGSSYGTFLIDGRKLPPQYPTELNVGSRFYLGEPGCMFQISLN